MSPAERYLRLKAELPQGVTLVAVSKQQPMEALKSVYAAGCRDFGESRVQEAIPKMEALPEARWHFIGTLQENKVRKIIGRCALIHSVDSVALARKISQVSQELGVTTPILLQVNTSGEPSKHGLSMQEWRQNLRSVLTLPMISVEGFMTMAPLSEDDSVVRRCFHDLHQFRGEMEQSTNRRYPHLSMGMSQDYKIAIEEGATIVRLGSVIFS